MSTDLILGTAGHIDHGKTSLIRALTGVETDRLPEEKRRGITIELGFAELLLGDYRLGIVDVPGHERFVRNMLAGATGIDLALLVVAADDSVKQQTREHFEILRLLNLDAGVIAVTKCDLVEEEWVELVEEEIRELVAGTFLADASLIRTSSQTGEGLDELKSQLEQAARKVASGGKLELRQGPFRMAIDRTFTIAGHGTVVTGSVNHGQTQVGEELVVEPGSIRVRVRSLQNHDRTVEQVQRGQRAAINLAGIHHEQIRRGQEVCSLGHLVPSRLLTVDLSLLDSAPRALKDRRRVRVHVGTAELLAAVRLLGQPALAPGEACSAQLFLSEPAVTVWNQPLVIRSESPIITIGGGRVLDPSAPRLNKPDSEQLEMVTQLGSENPIERASAALYFTGLRDWHSSDLSRTAGIESIETTTEALREQGELREVTLSPNRRVSIHRLVFRRLCDRIEAALHKLHDAHPLRAFFDRSQLAVGFRYLPDEAILLAALKEMQSTGRIKSGAKGIAVTGRGPKLSQNEQKLLAQLVEDLRTAGIQPPTVKQCQQRASRNQESVPQLLALAVANGDLVQVADDFFLHAEVDRQARESLTARLQQVDGLTMSEIREVLDTTRKYAVPYCEFLDRVGFTKRQGDLRVLAQQE